MRYIYKLIDPITNEVRYIGQTDNLNRRLNDHVSSSTNKKSASYYTHKSCWIRKLVNNGHNPIMEIIDSCETVEQSNLLERLYIESFVNQGFSLTNSYVTDVTEFSLQTKEKMSYAKKGKNLEEIVGEEKAKELKKYYSERVKLNNPNKSNNPLVREKISKTLKEYFSNPENHWAYGLKMTEDHNEKLRLAKLGNPKNVGNRKPRTENQKEKLRNAIKGRKIIRHEIIQYDVEMNLVKIWKSLREIERNDNSLSRNQISKCCKGERISYAGYIWKYKSNL